MSDLATIALEFCHVCLEWPHARTSDESCVIVSGGTDSGAARTLDFYDLSAVLDAARQWCNRTKVFMKVAYLSLTGKYYLTWMWNREQFSYVCESLLELPDYVMQGCMDAESRRKCEAPPAAVECFRARELKAIQRN
ncbi:MAG: hypothetical protein ABSH50_30805 [Bryobacteraceae bacterium]|jgi:hypothetical protein